MPMAPPRVPSPVLRAALPRKVLGWLAAPVLALALATPVAPDRAIRTGPEVAALAAALALALVTHQVLVPAPAAEAAPVEVINPALVPETLPALVPAINRAEAVGTKSQIGDE